MRRIALSLCLSAIALVSACSDRSVSTPAATEPATLQPRASLPIEPVCVSVDSIGKLIDAAFLNGSPDENSALGKWDNIQKQKAAYNGDPTQARLTVVQDKIFDLIDFMLDKKNDGKLLYGSDPASLAAFKDLINALFCYGLLNEYYYPGGWAWFIYPTDQEQSLIGDGSQVAMHLPANAVKSPSIVAITRSSADLATKFDQYGQTYEFSKYPVEEFAKSVVTEICVTVETPELFDKLVLGHTKSDGTFELLPEQSPRLACTPPPATNAAGLGEKLLSFLLPKKLYAAMMFGGGGVAGSLIELSPVRPVDPRVIVGKVAGGTSAPIGSLVDPAPRVRLATPNGTPFDNIRVDFATVTDGYNTGATPATASVNTDAAGEATVSWRLGTTPGMYAVSVTPRETPAADVTSTTTGVPGIVFLPAVTLFEADALPAAGLQITAAPTTSDTAGATIATISARIVDAQNRTVEGYSGSVTITAPAGVPIEGTTTRTVSAGLVSFSDLVIKKSGTHTLTLTATPTGTGAFVQTLQVTVNNGRPAITIVSGDGQQVTAPATLGNASPFIRVKVSDQFNNPFVGVPIYWRTFDASTPDSAVTTTGSTGVSGNSWRIQEGVNQLYASLDANQFVTKRWVMFSATGLAPRRSESLLACTVGNSRVGIVDHFVRMSSPTRIDKVTMYFSVQGDAAEPTLYPLVMKIEEERKVSGVWTFTRVLGTSTANVPLRGNTAQNDGSGSFTFAGGLSPASGSRINIRIERGANAPGGTLRFNAGTGSNCTASTIGPNFNRASAGILVDGVR